MDKGISLCIFGEPATLQAFELLNVNGFSCVELSSRFVLAPPQRQREILDWVRRCGLTVFSAHTPFGIAYDLSSRDEQVRDKALRACLATLRVLRDVNGTVLIVHASPSIPSAESRRERMSISVDSLKHLAAAAVHCGVKLAVELLPRTGLGNSPQELQAILAQVDTSGICLDTNHANLASSMPSCVERTAGRIFALHICDNDGLVERHWCPYRGVIDWGEFVRLIRGSSYVGPAIYEVLPSGNGLKRDLEEIAQAHERMWVLE